MLTAQHLCFAPAVPWQYQLPRNLHCATVYRECTIQSLLYDDIPITSNPCGISLCRSEGIAKAGSVDTLDSAEKVRGISPNSTQLTVNVTMVVLMSEQHVNRVENVYPTASWSVAMVNFQYDQS